MDKKKVKINKHYGFYTLDPIPTEKELQEFYSNEYYGLIKKGERAPEIRKLMKKDQEARRELKWINKTTYKCIDRTLATWLKRNRSKILDVGCGTGNLLSYLKKNKWKNLYGIEPSIEASNICRKKGFKVETLTLEDYFSQNSDRRDFYDVLILINILEHVPDPESFLVTMRSLLKPKKGILVIKVPNDFTQIQAFAEKNIKYKKWWIARPDHINYFNMKTFRIFLEKNGFKVIKQMTDFPMELFLLMGENYVDNPKLGKCCHKKRMNFEMSLPNDFLMRFYEKLSETGLGRDCFFFALKN